MHGLVALVGLVVRLSGPQYVAQLRYEMGLADPTRKLAVGCPRCGGSGYKGRVGLYEVMAVTEEIRELVVQRANVDRIADAAVRGGMRRLREDGLAKVLYGRTSFAEVARVTG